MCDKINNKQWGKKSHLTKSWTTMCGKKSYLTRSCIMMSGVQKKSRTSERTCKHNIKSSVKQFWSLKCEEWLLFSLSSTYKFIVAIRVLNVFMRLRVRKMVLPDMRFVKKFTRHNFGPEILHTSDLIVTIFTYNETVEMH